MLFKATVVQIRGVDGQLYTLAEEGHTPDSAAILLQPGAKGLDAPSFTTYADEYPAIDGGFVRASRASMREVFLPLKIIAPTRFEMMRLKRRFIASLNPTRGLVQLLTTEYTQVTPKDPLEAEPVRSLKCFYVSGMEGGESSSDGIHWATYGLILRAPYPYFQSLVRTDVSFVRYETLRPFIGEGSFLSLDGTTPGAGLGISSDPTWITSLTINNPGEVLVYPRWHIRGPLNTTFSIHLHDVEGNVAKALRFFKPPGLLADETLIVEMARGEIDIYKSKTDGSGPKTPMWWAYDITSDMWPFQPGDNSVSLVIDKPTGMTPEQEAEWLTSNSPTMSVSYLPAYLGI
ncbi:hypothetical protein [Nonomuraea jabiensis]|uniref:hypothetical protein n=1 Tax=Nonomuraea jabiensis TaxID=882448 RepID=UPI003D762863